VQAVQIHAVEASLRRRRTGRIVRPQPLEEFDHVTIAPHPARKSREISERRLGVGILTRVPDPAIDPIGVRPIRFDGDHVESLFRDQRLCQLGTSPVELMRAV
jgi:hypothetical protein